MYTTIVGQGTLVALLNEVMLLARLKWNTSNFSHLFPNICVSIPYVNSSTYITISLKQSPVLLTGIPFSSFVLISVHI